MRGHVYASETGLGLKHADVSLRPQGRFQPQDQSSDIQGGFEFRNVAGVYTSTSVRDALERPRRERPKRGLRRLKQLLLGN